MTLPTSRNRTYVAGVSQVDAGDLNDLQDGQIEGWHGSRVLVIPGSAANISEYAFHGGAFFPGHLMSSDAGIGLATYMLPLPTLSRLSQVSVNVLRSATAGETITASVVQYNAVTGATVTLASATSAVAAGDATLVMSALNHTLAAGFAALVKVQLAQTTAPAALQIYSVVATYDRPRPA